jgi:hypothetical protein
MPEPKTLPQHFGLPPVKPSNPSHDAWLARSETLVAAFERARSTGAAGTAGAAAAGAGAPELSLGFILMVADFLWDEHGEAADFGRLAVGAFIDRRHRLLETQAALSSFAVTLTDFYAFLVRSGAIDEARAQAVKSDLNDAVAEFTQPAAL